MRETINEVVLQQLAAEDALYRASRKIAAKRGELWAIREIADIQERQRRRCNSGILRY